MSKKILSICLCSISGLLAISSAFAKPCITYDINHEMTGTSKWTAGTPWQDITPTTRRCWEAGDYNKAKNRIVREVTTSKPAKSVYWANTNVTRAFNLYGLVWVEGTVGFVAAWFTNAKGDTTLGFGKKHSIFCGYDWDNDVHYGDCVLHID